MCSSFYALVQETVTFTPCLSAPETTVFRWMSSNTCESWSAGNTFEIEEFVRQRDLHQLLSEYGYPREWLGEHLPSAAGER